MQTITLPRLNTDTAWRDAARALAQAGTPPEAVLWRLEEAAQEDLFGAPAAPALPSPAPTPTHAAPLTVPRSFAELAARAVWHADPERFARLYALLWRLRDRPGLMADPADPDLARLREMEKAVNRCAHKMKAFVRFREVPAEGPRRRFAAWFEPTHHTLEPTAPFFARRFADMDWLIATPGLTARFEAGTLSFAPGEPRPDMPEDAAEELWSTYFRNIFNPARLKVQAMTSEMPRKYWKNLPEARHIPDMIASAEARATAMREAAPSLPPLRAARVLERLHGARVSPEMDQQDFPDLAALRARAAQEEGPGEGRGRFVMGEGPEGARLMIVGEQPGDAEDREGRPFVGPAGQVFDRAAQAAGLDRRQAYITNAVKRFHYEMRGKRRLHRRPNAGEISHGRWWLAREAAIVQPALILAMGATAAEALTGQRAGILKRRGSVEESEFGPVLLTLHPSYILRLRDEAAREAALRDLQADLEEATRRAA